MRPSHRLTLLLALALGCAKDAPAPSEEEALDSIVRRDSAGIEVVEVPGARRTFARSGRHLRTVGGTGEGPGEFTDVAFLARHEAGVLAFDRGLLRVTVLDSVGDVTEIRRWDPSGCPRRMLFLTLFPCHATDALLDGTVVTVQEPGIPAPGAPDPPYSTPGLVRWIAIGTEERLRTIDSLPVPSQALLPGDDGTPQVSTRLFAPRAAHAVGPRLIALGTGDRYRIRFRDATGRVVRVLRVDRPRAAVTPESIDSVTEHPYWKTAYEFAGAADSVPHFSALELDDAGRLWVADYEAAIPRDELHWTVFDPSGAPTARLRMPYLVGRFRPGVEEVLVVERDELGVERVAAYRIEGGADPPAG